MTCAELRERLDAYARGSLPPAEAAEVEAHLDQCALCSAYLEKLESPLAAAADLPKAVPPQHDLWPGIAARLAPRGRGRFSVPGWLLAAAAVLLIALSSATTALLLRPPHGRTATLPDPVSPLEVQYASAATELSAELMRARTRLTPATLAVIERNLAVIDSAIAESRRALARDPGNAGLERLVIAAWRQKMDFLRRVTALGTES
jgi:putative zinc finger protein